MNKIFIFIILNFLAWNSSAQVPKKYGSCTIKNEVFGSVEFVFVDKGDGVLFVEGANLSHPLAVTKVTAPVFKMKNDRCVYTYTSSGKEITIDRDYDTISTSTKKLGDCNLSAANKCASSKTDPPAPAVKKENTRQ